MDKFLELRNKYPEFIYDSYTYFFNENEFIAEFKFIIPGLQEFNPSIKIDKKYIKNNNINDNFLSYLVFNIGLVEMVSFYKVVCSPKIIVNAGYVNQDQINWFKKLIYNGLGEFLYKNNINISTDDLLNITCTKEESTIDYPIYNGVGNLIAVGGGKDSCVSLEILKNEDNTCYVINPKDVQINCCVAAGYNDEKVIFVTRNFEREKLVDLNNKGFLNGHIPISAVIAFISYLCAYLSNRKNIILSNESSANQSTVIGSNINHQYSKTIEFENDFRYYINNYFKTGINYFSLLRGLSEYQIACIFSKYDKYFSIFKSCNLGSKESNWNWCCNCPKCLFVYMILSPNLYKEKLVNIFGQDLYEREDLLETFKEIIGESETKPFECVGTIEEAKFAVSTLINKLDKDNLPYLLKYYYEHYELYLNEDGILTYNNKNNIDEYFNKLVMEELKND
ncbi:MAG: hypothetical protein IKX00_00700 [Bacilli bacterium]|nr:hypothetical protein [Bacilli bacterium]